MIRRIAVVPHPPLLVPELATGAGRESAQIRDAATAAVRWLAAGASEWHVIAAHETPGSFEAPLAGSFAGYGAPVRVDLSARGGGAVADLPSPVLVAGWLRARAGADRVRVELVSVDMPTEDCVALGKELRERSGAGLLVLGDGSNRHGPRAPGGEDPRAGGFDGSVAAALAAADPDGLVALEPSLAAELGATGRAPWQIAAGVIGGGNWHPRLLYSAAPYGVGYHVATWSTVARW